MDFINNNNEIFESAYEKALGILDYSPQISKILTQKLLKKGFDSNTCKKVIEKLTDNGFLNDELYAKNYAKELINNKNYGKNIIITKLEKKGIKREQASSIANEIFSEFESEEEIIIKFIKKNYNVMKEMYDNNNIEKIKRKFFNKGFSFELINKISKKMNDILSEMEND